MAISKKVAYEKCFIMHSLRRGGVCCSVLWIVSALLLIHFSRLPAAAESKTVQAKGMATISGGDSTIARDGAVSDALRKAVEQAVGTIVSADTMVENYQVLKDSIYTKSQGYVQSYRIVKEGRVGANLYQVVVDASVEVGSLKDDLDALGLLHQEVGKPRVLFMIAEQNVGQKFYIFWWWGKSEYRGEQVDLSVAETALKEEFLNNGFNVVDISSIVGTIDIDNAFKVVDLTNDGARSIARQTGAEVVVKGKAIAKEGPRTRGSSVAPYLADITATAIRVDNGQVIASARGHGVSRHISEITGGTEALEKAAKELSDKLIEQIVAKWSGEVYGGGMVKITIRGIGSFKELARIKEVLRREVRGVQGIYQRSYEGNEAVLDVEVKGNAQALADGLTKGEYGFPLSVVGTTANTIEVEIGGGR
ncbi:MAG: flagellar assembly protein T N-terminal domain-containing protein [Thermodesulfobacteriota bacterium]